VNVEMVGKELARETEVLRENLPHKSHITQHGIKPGPQLWIAGDYQIHDSTAIRILRLLLYW
jgi:hypothetical protein